jgi:catabolite regulation protein CreA
MMFGWNTGPSDPAMACRQTDREKKKKKKKNKRKKRKAQISNFDTSINQSTLHINSSKY